MYKLTKEVVIRCVAGEYMAIPVGSTVKSLNGIISLTSSGELLLRKLQEGCEYEDLITSLLDKYEVTREQAESDTNRFLGKLKEIGLIDE